MIQGMARPTQSDFFKEDAQPNLFEAGETPTYRPSIDSVRAHLQSILAETKAAQSLPRNQASLYRTIFPQMTLWLPEDEAAQLRLAFERKWSASKRRNRAEGAR
jgi:hypothetical protein